MRKILGNILDAIAESDQEMRVENRRLVDLVYGKYRRRPTLRRVIGAIEEATSEIRSSHSG